MEDKTVEQLEAEIKELQDQLAAEKQEDAEEQAALEEQQRKEEEARILLEQMAEDARLEEEARIEAEKKEVERKAKLKARISSLKDARHVCALVYPEHSNHLLLLDSILTKAPTVAGKMMKALEEKDAELALLADSEAIITNRKAEYPTMEEVLHIILDHGYNSQAMIELQEKRAAIKAKFPKGSE